MYKIKPLVTHPSLLPFPSSSFSFLFFLFFFLQHCKALQYLSSLIRINLCPPEVKAPSPKLWTTREFPPSTFLVELTSSSKSSGCQSLSGPVFGSECLCLQYLKVLSLKLNCQASLDAAFSRKLIMIGSMDKLYLS